MADSSPRAERPRLRRLGFVHVAAAQAAVCIAGLYALARDHSGPLRPGVDAVESAVRGVAGPVVGRFHGVPFDVLAFVDRKALVVQEKSGVLKGLGIWKFPTGVVEPVKNSDLDL